MKTKIFSMLAIAALMFAACSKDSNGPGGDTDSLIDPNGEAWVALNVAKPASLRGRAINPTPTNPATSNETKIESVRIIFFDASECVTKDVEIAEVSDVTDTPKAFKIPASSKYFLIVANANESIFPIQPVGRAYDVVNAAITTEVSKVADETDGFMMTNAKGGLEPSDTEGNLRDMVLHTTAEAAEDAAETVRIDRVVAKIRVYLTTESTSSAIVRSFEWLPNVTNKRFFPASERVKSTYGPTNLASDEYKLGTYRQDPNYTLAENEGHVDVNYNVLTAATATGWLPETSGAANVAYTLENTQNKESNMIGYTTQVLIKAEFSPQSVLRPGTLGTVNVAAGNDYVFILEDCYTVDADNTPAEAVGTGGTLREWLKAELINKYSAPIPDDYIAEKTIAFSNFLVSKGSEYSAITLPSTVSTPVEDAVEGILVVQFDPQLLKLLSDENSAGESGFVKYYKGGINYYPVIIEHDNNASTADNELGEFGVVRNSVYDITISSIINPGSPTIKEPDPNTPDEEKEYFGAIKIEVNDWNWYSQTAEL